MENGGRRERGQREEKLPIMVSYCWLGRGAGGEDGGFTGGAGCSWKKKKRKKPAEGRGRSSWWLPLSPARR